MLLWRWTKRLALLLAVLAIGLGAPVVYVETMCRGNGLTQPYDALISPAHHRPESRTLLTYPEWHIVHAYEDYAKVLSSGDPHDYGFLRAIGGFWNSLCTLSRIAPEHGGVDGGTKQMNYVIGVSFTAELALKAAYEETLGRLFAALRGPHRAPLDDLSADQAAAYAKFLQQVPWYKWQFREDVKDLRDRPSTVLRDSERRLALGLEYRAKAAYADVIAQAVAQVGQDELVLRMIVTGVEAGQLARYQGVRVLQERPEGIEIETPRYRALTHLIQQLAAEKVNLVEIAGNDDILFTAISNRPAEPGALFSSERQGFGDYRHLILVKVPELAERLRLLNESGLRLEHIHDY
ncbi:hypothetical protein SPOA0095 (plasmid) [Ruegeria pomeroyi DSS-3]|uniref:Uncharacterized protein n=2 Tax=Ruegeria pomeroyi TaxID=89184 RepID=Q5LLD3_RUEPO|nr:hypothetical protein [Ruegeria pomeroyi]AAV97232.1 hypothetical protein SPOA0095 [Ruegeria pomeroyi DSS-3]